MSSKTQRDSASFNGIVAAAIVLWAVTFALVHGPFVFGYVAMHAATTGIFLLAVRRSDQAREKRLAQQPARTASPATAKRSTTERVARPQPVA